MGKKRDNRNHKKKIYKESVVILKIKHRKTEGITENQEWQGSFHIFIKKVIEEQTTKHALIWVYITFNSSKALWVFTVSVKGTQNYAANSYYTLFIGASSLTRMDQITLSTVCASKMAQMAR